MLFLPEVMVMYVKPEVVKFGTLRDLTQLGLSDGKHCGIPGIGPGVGASNESWHACRRS